MKLDLSEDDARDLMELIAAAKGVFEHAESETPKGVFRLMYTNLIQRADRHMTVLAEQFNAQFNEARKNDNGG